LKIRALSDATGGGGGDGEEEGSWFFLPADSPKEIPGGQKSPSCSATDGSRGRRGTPWGGKSRGENAAAAVAFEADAAKPREAAADSKANAAKCSSLPRGKGGGGEYKPTTEDVGAVSPAATLVVVVVAGDRRSGRGGRDAAVATSDDKDEAERVVASDDDDGKLSLRFFSGSDPRRLWGLAGLPPASHRSERSRKGRGAMVVL
jgi:hypothetical protein